MTDCPYCCSHFDGHSFSAREMMFGTRERFLYAQCPDCCSCLLITPLDSFSLSEHYPPNYYSFNATTDIKGVRPMRAFFLKKRGQHIFGQPNNIGRLINYLKPSLVDMNFRETYGINIKNSVLDVGCGRGEFLRWLRSNGFTRLYGCDPYIDNTIEIRNILIKKCFIGDMTGQYDFIFFNHSFEHVIDPRETLEAARHLQGRGGLCVVRSPTTSSIAFERFHANWVQLDAPRHITIPSREGMRRLAARVGYRLEKIVDDSSEFQFVGSEQYEHDIPLNANNSYYKSEALSIFNKEIISRFADEARELNTANMGDQAAFILRFN